MSDDTEIEARLRAAGRSLPFPPTPDLPARAAWRSRPAPPRRRLALAAALAAALLAALLLAVPEARAAALRLLQIGAVRVRLEPAPPTALPDAPRPPPTAVAPPASVAGLVGATTLAEAAAQVGFPVRLPAYPADLGPPDLVYLQDLGGEALVLVWLDPADPSRARLSLHALSSAAFVEKTILAGETERLAGTAVGGAPALWVRGPHLLRVPGPGGGDYAPRRIVPGNTLIWEVDGLTYRLESELPLDEAVRVAESLR